MEEISGPKMLEVANGQGMSLEMRISTSGRKQIRGMYTNVSKRGNSEGYTQEIGGRNGSRKWDADVNQCQDNDTSMEVAS